MALALKYEPNRHWSSFLIQVHQCVWSFSIALCTDVGNGSHTLFWMDRWIHGQRITDLAPCLFTLVPKRCANKHMVREAPRIIIGLWTCKEQLQLETIVDLLDLWDLLAQVVV